MIRVAAFDTSTWWGGVALVESTNGGSPRTVAEAGQQVPDSHAARLLRVLENLLAAAGWGRGSLDAFAAARGPGSFTGVRVALATGRGLALAAGRPCLGVVTLQAMAEAVGPVEADRLPLIDAGRGELYAARYDPGGSPPAEQRAPWLGGASRVLEGAAPAVAFGTGAEAVRGAGGPDREGIRFARNPTGTAAAVGRIAATALAGGAQDGEGCSPLYLRPADAELSGPRR